MAIDFDKIDRSVDLKGLQADVEDAKKNGGGDFQIGRASCRERVSSPV